jgi:iron complex transport system substrate-binding protein
VASAAGPAVATSATSTAAAVSASDDLGRVVTLPHTAQRIISMSPHATELLAAAGAGARVVGVDSDSDVPSSAKNLPKVGDSFRLDIERIVALRPDLIVLWKGGSAPRQVTQLARLGIPLFYSGAQRVDRIADGVDALGKLMGTDAVAAAAATHLRQRLQTLASTYAARAPVKVFYQVWDQPLYTLNGQQIVSDALRVCGGINIFADLAATAPEVSIEAVLARDPEAVIGTGENSANGGINLWRAYPVLTAVRNGNLMTVDGNLMNRAGPRMVEGVAQLCERLEQARRRRPPPR